MTVRIRCDADSLIAGAIVPDLDEYSDLFSGDSHTRRVYACNAHIMGRRGVYGDNHAMAPSQTGIILHGQSNGVVARDIIRVVQERTVEGQSSESIT